MATHTVKQTGGDFSTLAAALADAGTATGDTISIEGTWTVADTASASTTDASITIEADADSKVDSADLASPSHYRLQCATTCISVWSGGNGAIIDGIEIKQTAASGAYRGVLVDSSGSTVTIQNSVIWAANYVSNQDAIVTIKSATVNVINCAIFDFGRAAVYGNNYSGVHTITLNVNSCSLYNSKYGVRFNAAVSGSTLAANVFNSYSHARTNAFHVNNSSSTPTWNIDYCIADDGSIATYDSGAVGSLASRTWTDSSSPGAGNWVMVTDITSSPPDLTLQNDATNNDAQEMHTSGSGAGLSIPSADIQGDTRSSSYDCGFDHIVTGQSLSPSGIASAETFGTAAIIPGAVALAPASIASAEVVPSPVVDPGAVTLLPGGIASAEIVPSPALGTGPVTLYPAGIGSAEALGSPVVASGSAILAPSGISSAEVFGAPVLAGGSVIILPAGIPGAAAFGVAQLNPGAVNVQPSGIASAESVGDAQINEGVSTVQPAGIPGAEAFGDLLTVPGAVDVQPSGIASAEAFGNPDVFGIVLVLPAGIASAESVGDALLLPGATLILPDGVASTEAFGTLTIIGGDVETVGWLLGEIELRAALGGGVRLSTALDGSVILRPA